MTVSPWLHRIRKYLAYKGDWTVYNYTLYYFSLQFCLLTSSMGFTSGKHLTVRCLDSVDCTNLCCRICYASKSYQFISWKKPVFKNVSVIKPVICSCPAAQKYPWHCLCKQKCSYRSAQPLGESQGVTGWFCALGGGCRWDSNSDRGSHCFRTPSPPRWHLGVMPCSPLASPAWLHYW